MIIKWVTGNHACFILVILNCISKHRCPVWEPKRRLGVDQPQQRIDTQTTQNLSVSKIPKYYCTKEKCERDGLGKVRFKFSRMNAFCITDIFNYFYHGKLSNTLKKHFVANNMLRFVSAKRLIRNLSEFLRKLIEHCANILNSRRGICVLI